MQWSLMVFILGVWSTSDMALPLFGAMAIVYLALCVYEVLHDARTRQTCSGRVCAAIEGALLVFVATYGAWVFFGSE